MDEGQRTELGERFRFWVEKERLSNHLTTLRKMSEAMFFASRELAAVIENSANICKDVHALRTDLNTALAELNYPLIDKH